MKKTILNAMALIAMMLMVNESFAQIANDDRNRLANLPSETIVQLGERNGAYTRVDCDLPDGKTTIWVNSSISSPKPKCLSEDNLDDKTFKSKANSVLFKDASYPADALKKKIEDKVEATCIVEKDGSLTDIKIIGTHFPSIEKEAMRLLSAAQLVPCKIDGVNVRCRYRIAMFFKLYGLGKNKYGEVLLSNASKVKDGIAKRFTFKGTRFETTTMTNYRTGYESSWTSGTWGIDLDIDVPLNNLDFEKLLCKILYNKGGKSIEADGSKFAKKFSGKLKDDDFKGKVGNSIALKAHCIGYSPGKYYSYGYEKKLGLNNTRGHNFIYDVQGKRLFTIRDLLTTEAMASLGINPLGEKDLALNEHFLFIVQRGERLTVSLSQENWNMFTPKLQSIIGKKDALPRQLKDSNFKFVEMIGYAPERMLQDVVSSPGIDKEGEQLSSFIEGKINKNIPDSLKTGGARFIANVSYLIEPDGTMSWIEVSQLEGNQLFGDLLRQSFDSISRWKPLKLSFDGAVRSLNTIKYQLSAVDTDNNSTGEYGLKVFDIVEQMPSFPGGPQALFEYLSKTIKYPPVAEENGVQGRVVVSFVVERDGTISDVKIVKSVDPSLDKEALRVTKSMPRWIPGRQKGETVRVKYTVPVTFRLK